MLLKVIESIDFQEYIFYAVVAYRCVILGPMPTFADILFNTVTPVTN